MLGRWGHAGGGAVGPLSAHLGRQPLAPLSPLLAAPDRPPCRRPRPGPARLSSALPARDSARSACAAAPPSLATPPRSARPRDPLLPAVPAPSRPRPTRSHTRPRRGVHGCTGTAASRAAHSHGVTLATLPHSRGPRRRNSPPHPRARAPSLPPVGSHGVTPSRCHTRRPHWNSGTHHHTLQ
ncbi:hypothetical protein P7K49_034390 [Saguinus oedipus]|uniref:Uncharacterized protein n=1 Tax=Saguinus oedipus TaxID=9490 RepID=A0ABQ9TUM1_SAGOE|nr:hypothetical protein P7K49_034390 [Saguinus oedipus]